jgi:hypothetical protein
LEVIITHHVDASEKNAQDFYDFYYEYDLFYFIEHDVTLIARSYKSEANNAHFLRLESAGRHQAIGADDLTSALFIEAANYLRKAGKQNLEWLSGRVGGYESVKFDK